MAMGSFDDKLFDDLLGPSSHHRRGGSSFDAGMDPSFVDSLLATLQVPDSMHPLDPSLRQDYNAGSPEEVYGNGHQSQHAHAIKETSGASSGSDRGGHLHQSPSLRVREKNKRAQRAFRQRQKDKSQAMGQQLHDVTERLEAVTLERELLHQKTKMLEAALAQARAEKGAPHDTAKPANEGDTDSNEESKSEIIEIPANSPPLRNNAVSTVRGSTTLKPTPDELYSADSGSFNLVTGNGRCYTFDDHVVQKMDAQRIALLWEEIVTYMGELLVAAKGDPNSPGGKLLAEATFSTIRLIARISTQNWRLKYAWLCQRAGTPSLTSGQPSFDWPAILNAMQLQQWQIDRILALRREYLASLAAILNERQEVERGLQNLAMGKETMSCVSQQHIALHSLAQRLGKLWQHTYQCMGSFARVIWTQIFDPFQAANFASSS
ncbi:hypothetical protein WJX73_010052 [Symbiochloris irregularis]|uniref:BZIP domain-containing protein n=1 Tax=Symbiochloris irregularis TaxID=706552 RepID=A0AAW1PMT9_9CHLO